MNESEVLIKKIPRKIAVRPKALFLHEAMGISNERVDQIQKEVNSLWKDNMTFAEIIEVIVNKYDGVEMVYALVDLATSVSGHQKLAELLSKRRGKDEQGQ